MKSPNILLLRKNIFALKREIAHVLSVKSERLLTREIERNVNELFALGVLHYDFANSVSSKDWRQLISRLYYAGYNITKTIRLAVFGDFSDEVKDHARVGELPDDFPNKSTYSNQLKLLRADRNLCDYDHTATIADLGMTIAEAKSCIGRLLADSKTYLKSRNFHV